MFSVRRATTGLLVIALSLICSLSAEAVTLTLEWDAPTDGVTTGYIVRYGTAPGTYTQSVTVGMVTSHSITTLADGVTYYFAVYAYDAEGLESPASLEVSTNPAAPIGLAATTSASAVTLSWQAVSGGVTGYRVEIGTATGQSNVTTTTIGVVTSHVVNSLAPGTYYMRVRSLTASGTSGPSNEVVVTVAASLAPPTNLTATARNGDAIDLAWQAPAGTLTGYRIEVGTATGQSNVTTATVGVVTSHVVNSLAPGTYYIRVRSLNAVGASGPSNEVVVTLTASLAPPTSLTGTARNGNAIDLAWQPPAGTLTGYRIEVGNATGLSNVRTVDTGLTTTHTLSSLAEGTYYIRVRTVNGSIVSPPGNEVVVTLVPVPGEPRNLVGSIRENRFLDLQWKAPVPSTVTGYRIDVGRSAGQSDVTSITAGTATTHSIETLAPGTYYIRVRAFNSGGAGAASNEITAALNAGPPPPTGVAAVVLTGSQIQVTWQAVGSAVDGYEVHVGLASGQSNVLTTAVSGTTTSLLISDLRGGPYFIRVHSVRGGVVSAASNEVQALCAPSAPTGLTRTVRGRRALDLTWSAPTGAAAYSIELGRTGGARDVRTIDTAATRYTIDDLPNGTYYVRVRARNTVGVSVPSNEVTAAINRSSTPDAPTYLTATLRDSNLIDLTWEDPEEKPQFYRVEVGTAPSRTDFSSFTTGVTSRFSIGELPAQTYYIRVRSGDDTGLSEPSNEVVLVVGGSAAPQRLAGAVNTQGIIRLTWDAPLNPTGVNGYLVEAGTAPGRSDLGTIPTNTTQYNGGPVAAGTYFIRVRAVTNAGAGATSNEIVLHVGGAAQCTTAPTAPRLEAKVLGSLVDLSWAPGAGDAPTGYVLDVGTTPGRRDIASMPLGVEVTTWTLEAPNGTYALRLTAVNACGASAWGTDATLNVGGVELAAPGAPANLTSQRNGRSITLTWAPANSGGEAARYVIEVLSPANEQVILSLDTGNLSTTFVHDNVPPGHYVVRLRALNARGLGPSSNAIAVTVE